MKKIHEPGSVEDFGHPFLPSGAVEDAWLREEVAQEDAERLDELGVCGVLPRSVRFGDIGFDELVQQFDQRRHLLALPGRIVSKEIRAVKQGGRGGARGGGPAHVEDDAESPFLPRVPSVITADDLGGMGHDEAELAGGECDAVFIPIIFHPRAAGVLTAKHFVKQAALSQMGECPERGGSLEIVLLKIETGAGIVWHGVAWGIVAVGPCIAQGSLILGAVDECE